MKIWSHWQMQLCLFSAVSNVWHPFMLCSSWLSYLAWQELELPSFSLAYRWVQQRPGGVHHHPFEVPSLGLGSLS